MEPWCENKKWGVNNWGVWSNPNENEYMAVVGRNSDTYNNVFWQLEQSYEQLHQSPLKLKQYHPYVVVSILTQDTLNELIFKIYRIKIYRIKIYRIKIDFKIDIYNENNCHQFKNYKGVVTPFIDKSKGLMPYKYYFMCENNFEPGFITEKL